MTALEVIGELFAELGADNPNITDVSQDASSPAWAVAFVEDGIVEAALDADRGKLMFSADIGRPEPESRLAVYEAVLLYNALGDRTHGVTVSLSEPDGRLTQTFELDLRDLTAVTLQNVVANFAQKAWHWRQVVANGAAAESVSAEGDREVDCASEMRV
jgi:hypothetical protein